MSILLDLMYASTIFEHSLFVMLRVGLYLRAARVARISVKAVIMAVSILEGIARTRMALRSYVCHKYVLPGFEGADREHAREVGVHSGWQGRRNKNVMGSADFFGQLEPVDVAPGLDDGRLHGACGLIALVVAPHVALVSSC